MNITLHPEQKGKRLNDLFGLFFEDINHAADGGLYAELIRNRDFEFAPIDNRSYTHLTGWAEIGHTSIRVEDADPPFPRNPHYAVIRAGAGNGICNLGFGTGICTEAGKQYRLSVWARAKKPMEIRVTLGEATATFALTTAWQKYTAVLTASVTDHAARLCITAVQEGEFSLAWVSMFPTDTWKGRENGLRRDLCEALAEMKPKFLRFPGGCLTHDGDLDPDARNGIYNWKRTVGPVENRPARRNNWGYHQTMGLGFYEYFLLCEDMGCEPLPVVNGGLDPHHLLFAEGEVLHQYIQDALDLIDFAKGGTDTEWGRVRAEMGHPEPFHMRYLAVGNEEVHEAFHIRMALFAEAIRAKDPTVELIGSAGPFAEGGPYDMGWQYAREQGLDHVDEHYYMAPEWFLGHYDKYDSRPADGPKVFLGEYASWGNKMRNALAEAAYMTHLQHAPAVLLACYAPMLCNVHYVNWRPDMLWFDGHRICKTPNYHVQRLFMQHQGDVCIGVEATDNEPIIAPRKPIAGGMFFIADDSTIDISDVKLTTAAGSAALPGGVISGHERLPIATTDGDFTLTFTFRRTAGEKGFRVHFGHRDEKNSYFWTVSGWQNNDSALEKRFEGRGSCLTQSNYSIVTGEVYHLKLEVSGDRITSWINGQKYNEVIDVLPKPKPLFLAASAEEATGDVILKAVNVGDQPVEAQINMPCSACRVEKLCASPDAENTLEQPATIAPVVSTIPGGKSITHVFPAYSVTVLRMKA